MRIRYHSQERADIHTASGIVIFGAVLTFGYNALASLPQNYQPSSHQTTSIEAVLNQPSIASETNPAFVSAEPRFPNSFQQTPTPPYKAPTNPGVPTYVERWAIRPRVNRVGENGEVEVYTPGPRKDSGLSSEYGRQTPNSR